jgi:hypothetical protein
MMKAKEREGKSKIMVEEVVDQGIEMELKGVF